MKGIRHVTGHLVADKDGMPVVKIDHDSLARATWELTMEYYGIDQPSKPVTGRQRLKSWWRRLIDRWLT